MQFCEDGVRLSSQRSRCDKDERDAKVHLVPRQSTACNGNVTFPENLTSYRDSDLKREKVNQTNSAANETYDKDFRERNFRFLKQLPRCAKGNILAMYLGNPAKKCNRFGNDRVDTKYKLKYSGKNRKILSNLC